MYFYMIYTIALIAVMYNSYGANVLINNQFAMNASNSRRTVNGTHTDANSGVCTKRMGQKNKNLQVDPSLKSYKVPEVGHPDFIIRDNFYMVKSDWQTIRGFFHENWKSVVSSYQNVCKALAGQPKEKPVQSRILQIGTVDDLNEICKETKQLQSSNDDEIRHYFMENFTPYLLGDDTLNTNTGTFTGYYHPVLNASRTRTERYKYPIYRKPPELMKGKSFYTRGEIDKGALNGKNLELFWVDNFVDLYFLHIQGSGMLKLTDGTYAYVKFSAKNGQQYESIGKYMLAKGYITKGSDVKRFLLKNERLAYEIMGVNKSYIFFEEDGHGIVHGAHGSELVGGRSLAVDDQFIPYGMMVFVDTDNHKKVMFAQDTGSAIKGVVRGDIFVGKGHGAGEIASRIHNPGFMYVLVHKRQDFRWV